TLSYTALPIYETVKKLCIDFGKPLISTSANLSEVLPSKDKAEIEKIFSSSIEYIVEGSLGGSESPSMIRDMLTGEIVRS
ncbi:MAG: Sua5/YciO/YrdC/YwlC family protein, partial [Pseudomonadota bacterium]|nr:Sua5/YciO/YrdC/YwlC family protein [Pseudomonadota bacterium]